MKLNLSRAAKKFTSEESNPSGAPRSVAARKPARPPVPVEKQPVIAEKVEPVVEAAPVPAPEPEKPRPVKAKRPRFVFVRQKPERRERPTLPPLPPPSNKPSARLMTRNLVLPPKDEAERFGR